MLECSTPGSQPLTAHPPDNGTLCGVRGEGSMFHGHGGPHCHTAGWCLGTVTTQHTPLHSQAQPGPHIPPLTDCLPWSSSHVQSSPVLSCSSVSDISQQGESICYVTISLSLSLHAIVNCHCHHLCCIIIPDSTINLPLSPLFSGAIQSASQCDLVEASRASRQLWWR